MRMKHKWGVWMLAAAVLAWPASGRAAATKSASSHVLASPASAASTAQVVREIDDPATGMRWLLERDPGHPGGPGRLVPVTGSDLAAGRTRHRQLAFHARSAVIKPSPYSPVIRAGDRLVIEENTAAVEARLTAVALSPAVAGASFEARLQFGGKVVRAVAVAPGRATLAPQTGAWK